MTGRIFHLEDGVMYARDLQAKLEAMGHTVVLHAPTIADALGLIPNALLEHEINLGILDRDLPDGSGTTVAQRIRNSGLQIPIIANSGYETDWGDYNITKLERPRLLETITRILGQGQ